MPLFIGEDMPYLSSIFFSEIYYEVEQYPFHDDLNTSLRSIIHIHKIAPSWTPFKLNQRRTDGVYIDVTVKYKPKSLIKKISHTNELNKKIRVHIKEYNIEFIRYFDKGILEKNYFVLGSCINLCPYPHVFSVGLPGFELYPKYFEQSITKDEFVNFSHSKLEKKLIEKNKELLEPVCKAIQEYNQVFDEKNNVHEYQSKQWLYLYGSGSKRASCSLSEKENKKISQEQIKLQNLIEEEYQHKTSKLNENLFKSIIDLFENIKVDI